MRWALFVAAVRLAERWVLEFFGDFRGSDSWRSGWMKFSERFFIYFVRAGHAVHTRQSTGLVATMKRRKAIILHYACIIVDASAITNLCATFPAHVLSNNNRWSIETTFDSLDGNHWQTGIDRFGSDSAQNNTKKCSWRIILFNKSINSANRRNLCLEQSRKCQCKSRNRMTNKYGDQFENSVKNWK